MTSPNGDCNWLWLRQLFDTNTDYSIRSNIKGNKDPKQLSDIFERPSKMVDYEAMNMFGIQFGHHYIKFRRTDVLASKRDEEITQLHKQRLVSFYAKYQDQGKQYASYQAFNELRDKGVRISPMLAYFSRPKKKIDDALIAREQNLSERAFIDRRLFVHLAKYKGNLSSEVMGIFDSFAIRISEDKDSILDASEDFKAHGQMPTLPSYHFMDDFGKLYKRVGGVARHSQYNHREYQEIVSTLDGIGGSEIVISESRKALTKMRDKSYGITLLMDYFAIPKHLMNLFKSVVMEGSRMFFYTNYQSYVELQSFMDIDSTVFKVRRQLSPLTQQFGGPYLRMERFMQTIHTHIRDMINSSISTLSYIPMYKIHVEVKPYSYARWALYSKIDPKFSRRALTLL
jgi:hypothetical protein